MTSTNINNLTFPEWYKVERETESTLKKLFTIKELDYYLKNADMYIRRLAIIRLAELKNKESVNLLREILDDPMENSELKHLAAWAIKSISLKWNLDLYMNNKYLSKYTGKEKLNDLYKVLVNDNSPSISFDFSSQLINSELQTDSSNIRLSDDISFNMDFPKQAWFKTCSYSLSSKFKKLLINFPVLLFAYFKKFFKFFIKASISAFKYIVRVYSNKKNRRKNTSIYSEYKHYNTKGFSVLIKEAIIRLLRVVFFPIRLLIKYKKTSITLLVTLYVLCTFTTYGRITTNRYLGLDFKQIQDDVYIASKEIFTYAWNELESITGLDKYSKSVELAGYEVKEEINTLPLKQFKITAKTGLNLRKYPDATSEKVIDKALENNLTVTYLSKSQKDEAGRLWYYIQTPDGKTGWVYSKWLEEVGGK